MVMMLEKNHSLHIYYWYFLSISLHILHIPGEQNFWFRFILLLLIIIIRWNMFKNKGEF